MRMRWIKKNVVFVILNLLNLLIREFIYNPETDFKVFLNVFISKDKCGQVTLSTYEIYILILKRQ